MSSLLAIIGGCSLICVPALISDFLFIHREDANTNTEFRTTYSSYVSGFRIKTNILNLMFYPIYMFRRLTFAFTIVILANIPSLQIALITLVNISVFS